MQPWAYQMYPGQDAAVMGVEELRDGAPVYPSFDSENTL